jgi:hypothetical protein
LKYSSVFFAAVDAGDNRAAARSSPDNTGDRRRARVVDEHGWIMPVEGDIGWTTNGCPVSFTLRTEFSTDLPTECELQVEAVAEGSENTAGAIRRAIGA